MAEQAENSEEKPVKKSKMKWIILLVILLLLGGAGAGAWFFFLKDMLHGKITGHETKQETVVQDKGPLQNGQIVPLKEFRVNLADPLGKRFIKLVLEVEATSPAAAQEVSAAEAPIRDSIILLLSSKSYADLAPLESKVMLKTEIGERINQILGGPKVTQVFITDMVIQ